MAAGLTPRKEVSEAEKAEMQAKAQQLKMLVTAINAGLFDPSKPTTLPEEPKPIRLFNPANVDRYGRPIDDHRSWWKFW